jgi:hypothetical protein
MKYYPKVIKKMNIEKTEKKESTLKKVARRTGYSYGYVKMVSCGRFHNREILVEIARVKEEESNEALERAENKPSNTQQKNKYYEL